MAHTWSSAPVSPSRRTPALPTACEEQFLKTSDGANAFYAVARGSRARPSLVQAMECFSTSACGTCSTPEDVAIVVANGSVEPSPRWSENANVRTITVLREDRRIPHRVVHRKTY